MEIPTYCRKFLRELIIFITFKGFLIDICKGRREVFYFFVWCLFFLMFLVKEFQSRKGIRERRSILGIYSNLTISQVRKCTQKGEACSLGFLAPLPISIVFLFKKCLWWHFLGGPVVKTPHFGAGGTSSIPWWVTKIPHASWQKFKRKKKFF